MIRRRVLALLLLSASLVLLVLLNGCGYLGMFSGPAIEEWDSIVEGMPVHYRIVQKQNDNVGAAVILLGRCTIAIDVRLSHDERIKTAAHELGHCIDGLKLNWSSNGWRNEGCYWGEHYCPPKEGFAEGFSNAYLLKCKWATSPLGLQPGDGIECKLPDPKSIVPGSYQ